MHTRISAKRGFAISRRGFFSVICSTDSTVDLISRLCWPPRQARSRLGISITGRRMSAFDKEPLTLSTSVRVSKLAINGNLLGPPGFDLDQRAYVLAADRAATDVDRKRRSVTRPRLRFPVAAHEMTSSVNLTVYSSSARRPPCQPARKLRENHVTRRRDDSERRTAWTQSDRRSFRDLGENPFRN